VPPTQPRPVIEYCGGTEIGGAFLSGTVLQAQAASTFSTPTIGTRLVLIGQEGQQLPSGFAAASAQLCIGWVMAFMVVWLLLWHLQCTCMNSASWIKCCQNISLLLLSVCRCCLFEYLWMAVWECEEVHASQTTSGGKPAGC